MVGKKRPKAEDTSTAKKVEDEAKAGKDMLREIVDKEHEREDERVDIEMRLSRAERELGHIGKKDLEVIGVERIKSDIAKLKQDVADLTGFKTEKDRKTIYGVIAIACFLGILAMDLPGLSVLGQRALAIFVLVAILWITELIPLPATALIPGVLLYLMGIAPTPTDAFKTYAHPAVFFVIGSLLIAHGLVQSKLAKKMAFHFISKCRNSPNLLLFLFIAVPALLSSFISDHLMAAMLIPVVISIVATSKMEGKFKIGLILAVAFGAGIGGMATPSGGSRNVIVLGLLEELTRTQLGAPLHLSYGQWMVSAFPIVFLMIPIVWVILRLLFPPGDFDIKTAMEELEKEVKPMTPVQWRALGVFLLTIFLFISASDLVGLGTVAILGAVMMFLVGAAKWEEAEKAVSWGVMFIYGAAITMGITLMETGAAQWLAGHLVTVIPYASSPFVVLLGVAVLAIILTNFMSDGAAASVLAPVTISLAFLINMDPRLMAMVTAIPCSLAFITVFGTPANTMAYSTGFFKPRDIAKAGFLVVLASVVVLYFVMKYYWPWLGIF